MGTDRAQTWSARASNPGPTKDAYKMSAQPRIRIPSGHGPTRRWATGCEQWPSYANRFRRQVPTGESLRKMPFQLLRSGPRDAQDESASAKSALQINPSQAGRSVSSWLSPVGEIACSRVSHGRLSGPWAPWRLSALRAFNQLLVQTFSAGERGPFVARIGKCAKSAFPQCSVAKSMSILRTMPSCEACCCGERGFRRRFSVSNESFRRS